MSNLLIPSGILELAMEHIFAAKVTVILLYKFQQCWTHPLNTQSSNSLFNQETWSFDGEDEALEKKRKFEEETEETMKLWWWYDEKTMKLDNTMKLW
jgi:hypothetical protein